MRATAAGRVTPYSEDGIRRMACAICSAPASAQWQACADGRRYRPICDLCDVTINALVVGSIRCGGVIDRRDALLKYAHEHGVSIDDVSDRAVQLCRWMNTTLHGNPTT